MKLTKIDHDTRQKLTEIMKEIIKIEITSDRLEGPLNNINYKQTLKTIDLMHQEFTHLDPLNIKSENMPIELFIAYEKWVGSLARRIHH